MRSAYPILAIVRKRPPSSHPVSMEAAKLAVVVPAIIALVVMHREVTQVIVLLITKLLG